MSVGESYFTDILSVTQDESNLNQFAYVTYIKHNNTLLYLAHVFKAKNQVFKQFLIFKYHRKLLTKLAMNLCLEFNHLLHLIFHNKCISIFYLFIKLSF